MSRLDYIFAARPMLHLPGWSIFLVALHYHHQLSGDRFSLEDLLVLLGITCMTAGAMYLNQVFDKESDAINQKLGYVSNGIISEQKMMRAFFLISGVGLAIGYLISFVTAAIFIVAFLLSWLYSAPPFRLKDRPFLGLFANGFSIGFLISIAVMPDLNLHNAGLLGWDNPFYFGLVVSATYCLTTIPDISGDTATGKRTIAVASSPRFAALLSTLLYATATYLAYRSGYSVLAVLSGYALCLAIWYLVTPSMKAVLIATKIPILILSGLAAYFYPAYFVFMIVMIWLTHLYYKRRFNLNYPSLR
ncbi:MAG: UbiA family prenyltransferase [bacterium]|nr:UbiA family prenyltransferase [bacterium]